jgi:hypothetical protein
VKVVRGFTEQQVTFTLLLVPGEKTVAQQISQLQGVFMNRNKDGSFIKYKVTQEQLEARKVRSLLFKKLTTGETSADDSVTCSLEFVEYDSELKAQNDKIEEQNARVREEQEQARKKAAGASGSGTTTDAQNAAAAGQVNTGGAGSGVGGSGTNGGSGSSSSGTGTKKPGTGGKPATPKPGRTTTNQPSGSAKPPDFLKTAYTGQQQGTAAAMQTIPGAPSVKPR